MLFSFLVCAFLLGPIMLYVSTEMLHMDIPKELTAADSEFLSGGTTAFDVKEDLTLENMREGVAQQAIEERINLFIPAKYATLLTYSEMQRLSISVTSGLFGWRCYPTHYGTDVVFVDEQKILMPMVDYPFQEWREKLDEFGAALSAFALKHPDKNFYIVIPDTAVTSTCNPVVEYSSDFMSTDQITEPLVSRCKNLDNVTISTLTVNSLEEYMHCFYKTDAHWNGYGALAYYNNMLALKGEEEQRYDTPSSFKDISSFNGQLARAGLMLLDDKVSEPDFESDLLESQMENPAAISTADPKARLEEAGIKGRFSFYATWYGGDYDSHFVNPNIEGGETALVISDSYGDAFRWLVANDYGETFGYIDLHSSSRDEAMLSERIESSGADDVYFVGSLLDYSTMLIRHGGYFE